ncbi:2984_t:CDS:2, partial [Dentiscutata erythropus]
MKQHFGGRAPHRLTPYVEVLQTRVNKVNKAAVCKACIDKLGREIALERSIFTNTKACTKAHFKKCQSFFEKYNEEERAEILHGFLDDNNWWEIIEELKSHLLPFMATLNHLQRDAARLSDVLHSFAYFMQLYKNKSDSF